MMRSDEVKEMKPPQETTAPEPESDDTHPRVVDRRRFVRLLDEESSVEAPVEERPRYPTYVEELQSRLRISEERLQALERAFQQARDHMREEIESFRQRQMRLLEERVEHRLAQILGPVLDVFDELKRALRAAEQTENAQALREGIRAILALFERRLQACGITILNPLHQPFDPEQHEAVEVREVEPERDGLVLDVLEPGYRLGEKTLIRPARVRVGRALGSAASESAKPSEGPEPSLEPSTKDHV